MQSCACSCFESCDACQSWSQHRSEGADDKEAFAVVTGYNNRYLCIVGHSVHGFPKVSAMCRFLFYNRFEAEMDCFLVNCNSIIFLGRAWWSCNDIKGHLGQRPSNHTKVAQLYQPPHFPSACCPTWFLHPPSFPFCFLSLYFLYIRRHLRNRLHRSENAPVHLDEEFVERLVQWLPANGTTTSLPSDNSRTQQVAIQHSRRSYKPISTLHKKLTAVHNFYLGTVSTSFKSSAFFAKSIQTSQSPTGIGPTISLILLSLLFGVESVVHEEVLALYQINHFAVGPPA